MNPKKQAKKLVDKFYNLQLSTEWDTTNENKEKAAIFNDELGADVELYWHELAKQSALFSVSEIIKSKKINYLFTKEQIYSMECTSDDRWIHEKFMKYWKQVKQEIKKL